METIRGSRDDKCKGKYAISVKVIMPSIMTCVEEIDVCRDIIAYFEKKY